MTVKELADYMAREVECGRGDLPVFLMYNGATGLEAHAIVDKVIMRELGVEFAVTLSSLECVANEVVERYKRNAAGRWYDTETGRLVKASMIEGDKAINLSKK